MHSDLDVSTAKAESLAQHREAGRADERTSAQVGDRVEKTQLQLRRASLRPDSDRIY